ncbi:chemotaxis protein CheW [Geobacillus sp. C56-T2]|uniref:chemotaxis protein CheW n=1 Tax=Geobacillus sp. C56-T2 TaxID=600773 RepID=UPI0011A43B41|nr:chemotaxis protein CheW [Geobacillus sp. C56-T2]NNV05000.1 chemotaxis protein CheW [Geobacillus sp. MMMUD3]TWG30097.1 purine-binding chemotaxis protein CheW [Geobacillus sp. C56-T2]
MTASVQMDWKVIAFRLKDEEYALPVQYVRSIEKMQPITRVPGTPQYVKGVINLRGVVTPIIDLRERFGFAPEPYNEQTRIMIAALDDVEVGFIVDAANDVLDLPASSIEPPPEAVGAVEASYVSGVAKIGNRLLILLDLAKVLER